MKICLATTNPHKLAEVRAVFDDLNADVDWTTLDEVPGEGAQTIPEPTEDQDTFAGNAELKARYYAEKTGLMCLADDSGIEVDALDGRPGVRSARYAGVTGPRSVVDPANNARLLKELAGRPDSGRGARYVCAMALAAPGGVAPTRVVRGTLAGRILQPAAATDPTRPEAGRGHYGFGYDPIVVLADGRTAAEFLPAEKNAVSHRGEAARAMVASLRAAGLL